MLLARGAAGCKYKGGAVQLVLDARGHDAHHAFVKIRVEHTNGGRWLVALVKQGLGHLHGHLAHVALDHAALAVDRVQLFGQFVGAACVVGQQAFDAQGHVGQAARCIDARAQCKAKVKRRGLGGFAAGGPHQRRHARGQGACAHPAQALGHQSAVVGVELDHIGHGAQSDQRQQCVQPRLVTRVKHAALAQLGPQGQQHIKHHAHTGDGFAGEAAAGLVGVDDGFGCGQFAARQMVVGHQHLQAQRLRSLNARHAGDAVVHGDQHIRALLVHALGNGRRQAVAVHHPVGHQITHVLRPQHAQTAHAHGAGGRPIAVVIGHDAQALVLRHGVGQQFGGFLRAQHASRGQQQVQRVVEFVFGQHATGGVQAGQQGVDARLFQRPGAAGGHISGEQIHGVIRRLCDRQGLEVPLQAKFFEKGV